MVRVQQYIRPMNVLDTTDQSLVDLITEILTPSVDMEAVEVEAA